MQREQSAGLIIFRKEPKSKENKFLLLHREAHEQYKESWDFPKGLVDPGETPKDTAKREATEEAGITQLKILPIFKEVIYFFYRKGEELISKEVIYFLAETSQKEIKVSYEHSSGSWFTYEEALKKLTFKNAKDLLKKANKFLEKPQQATLSP